MFDVEKNVPLPHGSTPRGFLRELAVGDSMLLPSEIRHKVMMSASQYKRRRGLEFTTKTEGNDTFRIWRVK